MFIELTSPSALIDHIAQVSALALDMIPVILGLLLLRRAASDLSDLAAAVRRMRVSAPAPASLLALGRRRAAEAATQL